MIERLYNPSKEEIDEMLQTGYHLVTAYAVVSNSYDEYERMEISSVEVFVFASNSK